MINLAVVAAGCSDAASFGSRRVQPGEESSLDLWPSSEPESSEETGGTDSTVTTVSPPPATTINEVGDPFEEEQCPDAIQRIESTECDPLGGQDQCAPDEGCYPYVQYPNSRCEPETFGTRCDVAGPGLQGQPCTGQRCAHGFLCVVTGRGTECAELCRMPGPNTCPDGFICGSLDIDGFGVCI